jgi:hypothetical protein
LFAATVLVVDPAMLTEAQRKEEIDPKSEIGREIATGVSEIAAAIGWEVEESAGTEKEADTVVTVETAIAIAEVVGMTMIRGTIRSDLRHESIYQKINHRFKSPSCH